MQFFNVWLIAGALSSPASGEVADEVADGASAPVEEQPELSLADEDDPTLRAWCFDDDDRHRRGYCLAKCERSRHYRAVSDEVRIEGNNHWCRQRAKRFCRERREWLDDWCWGGRGWDDDWDNDDGDGHGHGHGHGHGDG